MYSLGASSIFPLRHHKDWSEELQEWLQSCSRAVSVSDQRECLLFLTLHLVTAPPAAKVFLGKELDVTRIRQLLMLDALDSAVCEILNDAAQSYMISQPMGGTAICTMVVPGCKGELTFEARKEPMARVGAAAKALILLARSAGHPARLIRDQVSQ